MEEMLPIKDLTDALIKASTMTLSNLRDDEYIKDGLPYCVKCNTPRFVRLDANTIVRCLCECQEAQDKLETEMKARKNRYDAIIESVKKTGLFIQEETYSFMNTDLIRDQTFVTAFNRSKRYAEIYEKALSEGYGIYFYGESGVGKTHLMRCIKHYLDKLYVPMLIVTEQDIDNAVKATYSTDKTAQELIVKLSTIDFLGIDDLMTKTYTDTIQSTMFDILDKRATLKKPTMFSSNVATKDLIKCGMWQKTVDRIAGMSTAVMKIEGDSYRLKDRKKEVEF